MSNTVDSASMGSIGSAEVTHAGSGTRDDNVRYHAGEHTHKSLQENRDWNNNRKGGGN